MGTTHYYNGNHDKSYCPAPQTLAEASENKDFIFFVVHDWGCDDWNTEFDNITLYKAPDFAAYWAAIEEADIKRWKEWIQSI